MENRDRSVTFHVHETAPELHAELRSVQRSLSQVHPGDFHRFGSRCVARLRRHPSDVVVLGHGSNGIAFKSIFAAASGVESRDEASDPDPPLVTAKILINMHRQKQEQLRRAAHERGIDILRKIPSHRNIVRVFFKSEVSGGNLPEWIQEAVASLVDQDVYDPKNDATVVTGIEYLGRNSLQEILNMPGNRHGVSDANRLLHWAADLLAGTQHLLLHGIVHRDYKTDNVMHSLNGQRPGAPDGTGRLVLIDVDEALSVAIPSVGPNPTSRKSEEAAVATLDAVDNAYLQQSILRFNRIGGNPAHHSPEVMDANQQTGVLPYGREPHFALGVLLHEMATGVHPFGSAYPSTVHGIGHVATGRLQAEMERQFPTAGGPEARRAWELAGKERLAQRPPWLRDLILGLIAPSPRDRMPLWKAEQLLQRVAAGDRIDLDQLLPSPRNTPQPSVRGEGGVEVGSGDMNGRISDVLLACAWAAFCDFLGWLAVLIPSFGLMMAIVGKL